MIVEMQDLVRYLDVHIQEKKHGLFTTQRRLTSNFMYAIFQVILDETQDAEIDEDEDRFQRLVARICSGNLHAERCASSSN